MTNTVIAACRWRQSSALPVCRYKGPIIGLIAKNSPQRHGEHGDYKGFYSPRLSASARSNKEKQGALAKARRRRGFKVLKGTHFLNLCAFSANACLIPDSASLHPGYRLIHHRVTESTEIIRAFILHVLVPLRDQIKKSRLISQRRRGAEVLKIPIFLILCALCASVVRLLYYLIPDFASMQPGYRLIYHRVTESTEIIRAVILRVLAPLRDQIKKSRVISQRRRGAEVLKVTHFLNLCALCVSVVNYFQ
jgi:hypothetical protein